MRTNQSVTKSPTRGDPLRFAHPVLTLTLLIGVFVAMRSPIQGETMRAERIELIDAEGQVVGTLSGSRMGLEIAFPSGSRVLVTARPSLVFHDRDGNEVSPFGGLRFVPLQD